jgi:hypothetical protein
MPNWDWITTRMDKQIDKVNRKNGMQEEQGLLKIEQFVIKKVVPFLLSVCFYLTIFFFLVLVMQKKNFETAVLVGMTMIIIRMK